ncbi:MAG: DUF4198 domain-containing protein [Betaproteobacteria bacterium]|nr:DUF4198 domain-containing protein [Betaproteobacteria bacterium]
MKKKSRAPAWLRLRGLTAIAAALGMPPLFAHDFWIEPSIFSAQPGQRIELRLRVGEHLAGDPVLLDAVRGRQFVMQDAVERKPVAVRVAADPAGSVTVSRPGLQVIGYFNQPARIELPAEKFNAYLKEEGLDSIIALRGQRNQTDSSARELYARCAKSLVLSGEPDESGDRRLGFPLELLAERNPYTLAADQLLPVRLTFLDKPVEGALVMALSSLNPAEKLSARTDRDGRVQFQLRASGMWLIKAVHMIEVSEGIDADWASYWASLTFALPGESPAPAKPAANNTRASSDLVGSSVPRPALRDARSPRRTPIS